MKRCAAVIVACLIAFPGMTLGVSNHIARASGPRYKSVPLESLGIVQADSSNATILTPASPGHYRDQVINSGVQIGGSCSGAHAEFHLAGKYDVLRGTVYSEETNDFTVRFSIYDTSNPANKRALFGATLPPLGQTGFHLSVRGVTYLTVANDSNVCDSLLDVVAQLTSGTRPPTQVVPRYPTNNAGEPANSTVLFGWQPFPGAANYAFHIWMVSQSGTAAISDATPLTFAATIHHKTSYTWDDKGFLPGTYQYALLPLDAHGKALAGWSPPTQITLAR